jgi:endonuclease-8
VPEGDTIHRTAATLRAALGRGPLAAFSAPGIRGPYPQTGEAIDRIDAKGKHLLIRFEGGSTLHTHLRMEGSWRVLEPGAAVTGSPVVVLATDRATAVCRKAPVVELLDDAALRRHPQLSTLGPDLCLPDVDLDEILRRVDALGDPDAPIAVALLDQRLAAGIGNVYRSEVLWACRVAPFTPLGRVGAQTRRALFVTASQQLRANLGPGPRRTVPEGLAVYDRSGRRCRRCGATIRSRRIGDRARTTWWCPGCQTDD